MNLYLFMADYIFSKMSKSYRNSYPRSLPDAPRLGNVFRFLEQRETPFRCTVLFCEFRGKIFGYRNPGDSAHIKNSIYEVISWKISIIHNTS